jgi:DNA-directed RNA polymerase subunit delta
MTLKRIIKDYKTASEELLMKLNTLYPNGISDKDVITFANSKGETYRAVEVRTEDTIYLIKMSQQLREKLEDFDVEEEEDYESSDEADFDLASLDEMED